MTSYWPRPVSPVPPRSLALRLGLGVALTAATVFLPLGQSLATTTTAQSKETPGKAAPAKTATVKPVAIKPAPEAKAKPSAKPAPTKPTATKPTPAKATPPADAKQKAKAAVVPVAAASAAVAAKSAVAISSEAYYRAALLGLDAGKPLPANPPPSTDPLLDKVLKWASLVKGLGGAGFEDVAQFLKEHPDWPGQNPLRRRAEDFLLTEPSDSFIVQWFDANPPQGREARQRYADGLAVVGRAADAATWLRRSWAEDSFAPSEEVTFATRYADILRPEDHRARADRALSRDGNDTAQRVLTRLSPADQAAVTARLSIRSGTDPDTVLGRVDKTTAADSGVIFDAVRAYRRAGKDDAARTLLAQKVDATQRPDLWWTERDLQIRRLLREGSPDTAYRLARDHGLPPGTPEFADAEFLAGLIALRWQKQPSVAFGHFQALIKNSRTPPSQSRGAFWAARAALAQGQDAEAKQWLMRAAAYPAAFYGQLATALLGETVPGRLPPETLLTGADKQKFDSLELVRVVRRLTDIGLPEKSDPFLFRLAEGGAERASGAAQLAYSLGRTETSVLIARRVYRDGTLLAESGYPILPQALPTAPEPALVHAIIRQESNYSPTAVSKVGARGLMQLMPATAKQVAGRLGLSHTDGRLTAEPSYNIQLGQAYLATVLDQFNGDYALAIASYNAGPGRVRQWLRDYGDPGTDIEGWLTWIEQIPFSETRN
ncbi:MAG: transglycosylase SLT domain-containing protein, partial [Elstera sp.]